MNEFSGKIIIFRSIVYLDIWEVSLHEGISFLSEPVLRDIFVFSHKFYKVLFYFFVVMQLR